MTVDLFFGDSLVFMRKLGDKSVDLVLADPSYGTGYIHAGGRGTHRYKNHKSEGRWDEQRPGKEYFDEMLRIGKVVIVWGGNYFTDYLPPSQQWLVWDKGQREFSLADAELAWSSQDKATRVFTYPRVLMVKENGLHPNQKPVALMEWCMLEVVKHCSSILDPFMGSGTTGVASLRNRKDFMGCEINPRYFSIAEKRIKSPLSVSFFEP